MISGMHVPVQLDHPVSKTYCYCCAEHFRFHYQIALGIKLQTKEVVLRVEQSQPGTLPIYLLYN